MEFAFDEDQISYQKAVKGVLATEMPAAALRQAWDDSHRYGHAAWSRLSELGLPGVVVEEKSGGFGGSIVDLVLPLEECGAAALPEPFVESALVAPIVLQRWGRDEDKEWLTRIASGEVLFAVAHGTDKVIVADGMAAHAVLVVADEKVHLFKQGSFDARPLQGTDPARRLAECSFDVNATTLVTDDPAAARDLLALGALGTAAALVGLSTHLTALTREHLLTRTQFDRVLGSFQALKHRLADVAVKTEAARSLVWYAAYVVAEEPQNGPAAASLAKAAANEAAAAAGFASLQLHGGVGFTWEHDLHLYLQRGRAWEMAFGTTDAHRLKTGTAVLSR